MKVQRDPETKSPAPVREAATDTYGEKRIPIADPQRNGPPRRVRSLSELEQLQARIAAVETGIEWGKTG